MVFLYWAILDDLYAVLTHRLLLRAIRGHMRSNSFFLALTFDRIEIERWQRFQSVSFAKLLPNIAKFAVKIMSLSFLVQKLFAKKKRF